MTDPRADMDDSTAHRVMTPEEYSALKLIGWHSVCKNVDGLGSIGIRYQTEEALAPPLPDREEIARKHWQALLDAAKAMPRATPACGGASTAHPFTMEAWQVWDLDRAIKAVDAILALREPGELVATPDLQSSNPKEWADRIERTARLRKVAPADSYAAAMHMAVIDCFYDFEATRLVQWLRSAAPPRAGAEAAIDRDRLLNLRANLKALPHGKHWIVGWAFSERGEGMEAVNELLDDITPTSPPAQAAGVEDIAKWLHDETGHPDSYPDHAWPETDRDDGRREGGWVKIVPQHAQSYFRDIARRLVARLSHELPAQAAGKRLLPMLADAIEAGQCGDVWDIIGFSEAEHAALPGLLRSAVPFAPTDEALRDAVQYLDWDTSLTIDDEVRQLRTALGRLGATTPTNRDALVEALRPFAKEADKYNDIPGIYRCHDNVELWQKPNYHTKLCVGDLRAARAALSQEAPDAGVAVRLDRRDK